MSNAASIHLSSQELLAISDALVAVERHLTRYHGRMVRLDAEPFRADFALNFKSLVRAKQFLGRELVPDQRAAIVHALRGASIAIALHDGNPMLEVVPAVRMDFGDASERVRAALRIITTAR